MPRLLRAVLALLVIFSSVLLALRMIGGTRTAELAIVFTNPDGSPCQRPCLFGIRPGETTANEAIELLKSHPFMRNIPVLSEDPFLAIALHNGPAITFSKTPDNLVDTIRLAYNPPQPEIGAQIDVSEPIVAGNMITAIGSPDYVCRDEPAFLCYYYDDGRAVMVIRTALNANLDRVETNNWVQRMTVFFKHKCPSYNPTFPATPWLGFTSTLHYNRAANLLIDGDPTNPIPCLK